ncbi:hypothetical protein [Pararhizobium sp. PWRC1-1]|uniref:hypothetical protein n=1 Tax=Pararhizobium sp. PWRC1-1 TaxID=2804566 RepID=UPI003CF673B1
MATREQLQAFVRNKGPIVVFAALTFGGMAFIWTAKTFEWNTYVVTAVPICLMLFYFGLSFVANGLRLHNEQAGDNLYYMGFLYTLSSLGVSLYRFTDAASIDDIVRNFGIAVTSTIVGITLRILFNQMRRDPLDIERSVRHELAEMTRKVRTELDSSAREFSSYRRTSSEMLSEGFEEIARQAEKSGEAVQKAIEAVSREAIRPIQEAAEKLAIIMDANNKVVEERAKANNELAEVALAKLQETSNSLSGIIASFGGQVEAAGERLAGMRLPEDVLKVELTPVLAAIAELGELQAKRLNETAVNSREQAERMTQALLPLDRLPERLDASLKPLDKLPEAMRAGYQAMDQVPAKIEASLKPFEGMGDKIELALKPLSGVAKRVSTAADLLDKASAKIGDATTTLEKTTKSTANQHDVPDLFQATPFAVTEPKGHPIILDGHPSVQAPPSEPAILTSNGPTAEMSQPADKQPEPRKLWRW